MQCLAGTDVLAERAVRRSLQLLQCWSNSAEVLERKHKRFREQISLGRLPSVICVPAKAYGVEE
jgi:hypothetical protein